MTETVQDRLHVGRSHEIAVREKLKAHGWDVQDWGQGLLDDTTRLVMYSPSVELKIWWRWLPDLIATKGSRAVLVDPKTDLRTDTANFSIEQSAWWAHRAMLNLGLPIVYVWSDFSCNLTERLQPVAWLPGTGTGRTAYCLVRKVDQHPFEWAFGLVENRAA